MDRNYNKQIGKKKNPSNHYDQCADARLGPGDFNNNKVYSRHVGTIQ